jgi:hypothetical protein
LLIEVVTYYITDLPGYSSLAGCAATALSMAAQDVSPGQSSEATDADTIAAIKRILSQRPPGSGLVPVPQGRHDQRYLQEYHLVRQG